MTYRISQIEDKKNNRLIVKIEGSFNPEGGQKIEEICLSARAQFENVSIDCNDVTFLDETSSAIICRLKNSQSISLSGCHLFTKRIIERAEGK
jgi:anti-anti-sigma regulatory factor